MRRLAILALLAAACTNNSVTTTTTIDPLTPPPSPTGPTTTTLTPPTTVPVPIRTTYEGALPDGTTYTVFIEGIPEEEVTGFGGVVMFEGNSGAVVAGETLTSLSPIESYTFQDGESRIPAGSAGSFVLKFYDDVLEELGPDADVIIQRSMTGSNHLGIPQLLLASPFRWMTPEDQIPAHMQVQYETFVVRQGCDDLAIACNVFHGIQVIPMERVSEPARRFEGENVSIDSPATRLLSDPNRVDPGPLQTLTGDPDIFWTGEEMIVWGGYTNGIDPHNQGALLDPTTSEWRLFDGPDGIIEGTGFTRGIWVDDEMLIITEDGTFAGDPSTDRWTHEGEGLELRPEDPLGVIDGEVYGWTDTGIIRIGRDGTREDLGHPGYTLQGRWRGSLLDFGGHLLASGTDCLVRRTAIWNGSGWTELETIRFRVCSWGDLVAVVDGELMTWATDADPTYLYNAGELGWDAYDPVPHPATDRPSGPLVMGDRLFVPQFDEGAIFDVASRQWTAVDPPGYGFGDLMVWTGDEVISWVFGFDAWRWTPPESG